MAGGGTRTLLAIPMLGIDIGTRIPVVWGMTFAAQPIGPPHFALERSGHFRLPHHGGDR